MLLCGNATDCPHLQASEWTLTNFLQKYFKSPESLVNSYDIPNRAASSTFEDVIVDRETNHPKNIQDEYEAYLWETNPWVICGKAGNCSKSISKTDWLADRGGQCKTKIVEWMNENPGQLAVEMDLCNLNIQMDGLCQLILESVIGVSTANCLSLGSDTCLEKSFFYSPSTWSSSNQEVITHLKPLPKCTLSLPNLFKESFHTFGYLPSLVGGKCIPSYPPITLDQCMVVDGTIKLVWYGDPIIIPIPIPNEHATIMMYRIRDPISMKWIAVFSNFSHVFRLFFYTQFVRDTVRNFYRQFKAIDSPNGIYAATLPEVCPAESDLQRQLQLQNSVTRQKCGSVQLQTVIDALLLARIFIDQLIYILYDMLQIGLDLMQLAGLSTSSDAAYKQTVNENLMFWFRQWIVDMMDALKALGELIFKMIFENSPIGVALKTIIKIICQILMWVVNDVWKGFMCPIVEKLAPPMLDMVIGFLSFIDAIVQFIQSIAGLFGASLPDPQIIQKAIQKVDDVKTNIENGGLGCKKKMDNLCFPEGENFTIPDALPASTTCWAGYQSYAGDASPLSCQRSDTCTNEMVVDDPNTGIDERNILCDSCPLLEGEDFLPFACSPLTKKCSCGVQKFEPTR